MADVVRGGQLWLLLLELGLYVQLHFFKHLETVQKRISLFFSLLVKKVFPLPALDGEAKRKPFRESHIDTHEEWYLHFYYILKSVTLTLNRISFTRLFPIFEYRKEPLPKSSCTFFCSKLLMKPLWFFFFIDPSIINGPN